MTTTTDATPATTDEDRFLAAIARTPEDTDVRLVFADWLQENADALPPVKCPKCGGKGEVRGDGIFANGKPCLACGGEVLTPHSHRKGTGTVRDTSRADRAELIRVQCELAVELRDVAPLHHNSLDMILDPQDREQQAWKHKVWGLQKRESDLLARVRELPGAEPKCYRCFGPDNPMEKLLWNCPVCSFGKGEYGSGRCPCTWERGFPSAVTVPTLHSVFIVPSVGSQMELKPTEWGRELVEKWPVTRIKVNEPEPLRWYDGLYRWYSSIPLNPAELILPEFLVRQLTYREFKTIDDAQDALGDVIAWSVRKAQVYEARERARRGS